MERNFQTLIVSLLKPWRFCLKRTGPFEVVFTAIPAPSITGHKMAIPMRLKVMSNTRFATESQSRIGLSNTSSIGTLPTWE
ncbi:hypothetical protein D3C86_1886700 [compost metagenome]